MKIKDLQNRLPELQDTIDDKYVNPLSVLESFYFGRKTGISYERKAVDRAVSEKLDFCSTCNSIYTLIKSFVKIKCPMCGKEMTTNSAGGNAKEYTVHFRCECGTKTNLSCPTDGFSVEFVK